MYADRSYARAIAITLVIHRGPLLCEQAESFRGLVMSHEKRFGRNGCSLRSLLRAGERKGGLPSRSGFHVTDRLESMLDISAYGPGIGGGAPEEWECTATPNLRLI